MVNTTEFWNALKKSHLRFLLVIFFKRGTIFAVIFQSITDHKCTKYVIYTNQRKKWVQNKLDLFNLLKLLFYWIQTVIDTFYT